VRRAALLGLAVAAAAAALGLGKARAAQAPGRVQVAAQDFRFALSRLTLRPGTTIVELVNDGEDVHDLRIQRVGGGPVYAVPETASGDVAAVTVNLPPGRYRFWCGIANHAQLGMRATVLVKRGR
jgi:plastocyanin